MLQRLQKERASEERNLQASRATLKEQQLQLETELKDQKDKLDQAVTKAMEAEERVRVLQGEEKWGETLEKSLSKTSTCSGSGTGFLRVGGGLCWLAWKVC